MPVIGVWNATDPRGSLPGVASAGEAFNGEATGMTTLTTSFTQPKQLRIAIADQRGDGRPDYNYQARVLYADSVTPATVSGAGGTVTITGMGFRTGNAVFVNGVAANVSSWTANTIVARVPSLHTLGVSTAFVADVTVKDLSTGGTTVMTQALSYATPVTTLSLLTAPSGTVILGQQATMPFAVQVLQPDGVTPVVGETVTFIRLRGRSVRCMRRSHLYPADRCERHRLDLRYAGGLGSDHPAGHGSRWHRDCVVHRDRPDSNRDGGTAGGVCRGRGDRCVDATTQR